VPATSRQGLHFESARILDCLTAQFAVTLPILSSARRRHPCVSRDQQGAAIAWRAHLQRGEVGEEAEPIEPIEPQLSKEVAAAVAEALPGSTALGA
jgi:hypothetical protein